VDLRISDKCYLSRELCRYRVLDPYDQECINDAFEFFKLPITLPPQRQILLSTVEVISVPPNKVGFIGLRSTWARLGLICPQTVADPGFEGTLTFEVFNTSVNRIQLSPGDVVFHIFYVPVEESVEIYTGRYQHQIGVTLPKSLKIPQQQV